MITYKLELATPANKKMDSASSQHDQTKQKKQKKGGAPASVDIKCIVCGMAVKQIKRHSMFKASAGGVKEYHGQCKKIGQMMKRKQALAQLTQSTCSKKMSWAHATVPNA